MPRPDAVKIPESAVGAARSPEAVVLLAERLLAVDVDGREFARCGDQRGWYFATRCTLDDLRGPGPLLFNPPDAPRRAGLPRYSWTPGPNADGVEFGTLIHDDD